MLDAHHASIWRLLRRFGVPQPALDDAAQEVFWIAARRLAAIKHGSEHAFLYGIAVRVAAEARRTAQRNRETPESDALELVESGTPNPEQLLDERRTRELLDHVLDAMSTDLRTAFVLFELEGLEIQEIAEVLGIPMGTVGSRLRRAREEFSTITKRIRARLGGSR
jgi:RNA polymerase sigma-70 factor (ECF subfamily)